MAFLSHGYMKELLNYFRSADSMNTAYCNEAG